MKTSTEEDQPDEQDGKAPGAVKKRVRSWVCGFVTEMRKKSPATIQKWVDSIAVDEIESPGADKPKGISEANSNCDSNELKSDEPSTSGANENLRGKLNEICSKLSVNEKLKNKKHEFKNLLVKTTQKLKRELSQDSSMEQKNDEIPNDKTKATDDVNPEMNKLTVQRCPIGMLGRSSSENPNPINSRNRRLNDIGRSFSVANDNEIPTAENSSENLIYDADEDISITIPSLNTSPSIISNNTNQSLSNSQLFVGKVNILQLKPLREHTVSEGHQSPQVQTKNPLLRDSSFQSDSSHCSSVESLLEARKPDAEAILINLGFGPAHGSDDIVSKIPKRFLKPSQVNGVDTDAFLRNQHLSNHIHENSVLGYRGLLGNSHSPSKVVKAIIERFSANEIRRMSSMESIDCRSSKSFKGAANTVLAQQHFMK